ncbi:MAG: helix-turn-helix domain-containing protein, partial [Nitrosospira sp.]|nr:helix-turn-helix domain-containing protein [Nitrosospira sp.]
MKPYTWQTAILASSLPPTMRHVLLTLGCHLNVAGEACFPSTKLLAQETGLSERAVVTHLGNAKTLGWIVVRSHGLRGQKWRRHEYFPTIPKSAEALNEVQHQGTELDSAPSKKALNVVPKGAEPNDEKALNEVQSNSPYIYPRNSPVKIKHAGPVK